MREVMVVFKVMDEMVRLTRKGRYRIEGGD